MGIFGFFLPAGDLVESRTVWMIGILDLLEAKSRGSLRSLEKVALIP